ncbi:MAG TPA: exodeoxyribonuclease VII large subunit [Terracidiphilus sp.]|nr:exodeoxyribonuclease VII large subunit [Terracidiphilus sp.]
MAREKQIGMQLGLTFDTQSLSRHIWAVSQIVRTVREMAETAFPDVWVEGEISNLRPAPSGHVYFTLKDAEAQLPVVLFRRQAMLLRFRLEDGQHVLVRGRASIYEQRGQLQLVAETLEPVGIGSLQLAFEQLKERLNAEGLFSAERKRPLPAFPRSVGIVTSPTGAVIRDFLNIVSRRHSGLNVCLYPATVQGEQAPEEIEAAIAALNAANLVDVIVVARGGGSLEDLAAFNSERVARAIAASHIPVVSAVGHETDFTIADFVADLRAPTPSAAAELITDAQYRIAERVQDLSERLERGVRYQLMRARNLLERVAIARSERRMTALLHISEQRLDDLSMRLTDAIEELIFERTSQINHLENRLIIRDPRIGIGLAQTRLLSVRMRLDRAVERTVHETRSRWDRLHAQLRELSPLAVLDRGYALTQSESGVILHSVTQAKAGDRIVTRLRDGSLTSIVEHSSKTRKSKK